MSSSHILNLIPTAQDQVEIIVLASTILIPVAQACEIISLPAFKTLSPLLRMALRLAIAGWDYHESLIRLSSRFKQRMAFLNSEAGISRHEWLS